MTRWNPRKVADLLNKRFAHRLGKNRAGFEVTGGRVIITNIEKGPKVKQGGAGGVDWASSPEIELRLQPFVDLYANRIKVMERDLLEDGYAAKVSFVYMDGGLVSLLIQTTDKQAVIRAPVRRNPPA